MAAAALPAGPDQLTRHGTWGDARSVLGAGPQCCSGAAGAVDLAYRYGLRGALMADDAQGHITERGWNRESAARHAVALVETNAERGNGAPLNVYG